MANINGTSGNDSLVGTSGNDSISGSGGDDTLVGNGGKDTLNGGTGNDVYVIDSADDSIAGESSIFNGTDTIETTFDFGTTALRGYIENLTLRGAVLNGYGNSLNNVLRGNELGNALYGDTGADTIYGGGGNDNILGGTGTYNDVLYGEAGNDYLDGDAGNDTLDGGADNDNLYGGAGNDSLVGGSGNDLLVGGGGTDTLVGGDGGDTYEISATDGSDVINETGTGGRDLIRSALTFSIASRATIEDVTLTGTSAINATGNAQANILTGNSGNNRLDGGAGDDTLMGGAGVDTLAGGDGGDVYILSATDTGDVLEEAGTTGRDRIEAAFTTSIATRAQFEDVTLTGTAAINATGNDQANVLRGNALGNVLDGGKGHDTLFGGDGNDVLNGGDGDDYLDGGLANDTLIGGEGSDTYVVGVSIPDGVETIQDTGTTGRDTVLSSIDYTLNTTSLASIENLTLLQGSGALNATGNASSNEIIGNSQNNVLKGLDGQDTLSGEAGNDLLDGGVGNDIMAGGLGDDVYWVDSELDQTIEASNGGNDTVVTTLSSYTLSDDGEIENLVFQGDGGAVGHGNAGNNAITGGAGDDMLDGGIGDDTLTGGAGQDFYVFSGDFGADTIVESDTSTDIDIVGLADVNPDQLWFSHVSGTDDLLVSVIGTDNQVTLSNWYAGSSHTLEFFQVLTPTQEIRSLARDDVATLVQFMAGFGAAPTSLNSLSEAQRTALNDVVAANWVYWSPAA